MHKPRSIAGVLRGAALSLAAGLVVTVTMAWLGMFLPPGNAWYGPRTGEDLGVWEAEGRKAWLVARGRNAWHTLVTYWHMQISGQSLMITAADYGARKFDDRPLPRHLRSGSLTELNTTAWFHATGWPMPALACCVDWERQVSNADVLYRVRGGLQLPRDSEFNPRALQITPLWPGFVVNTLVFAAMWLVLIGGTRGVRGVAGPARLVPRVRVLPERAGSGRGVPGVRRNSWEGAPGCTGGMNILARSPGPTFSRRGAWAA